MGYSKLWIYNETSVGHSNWVYALESIDNGYLPSESFERTFQIKDLINCKLKCTFDK